MNVYYFKIGGHIVFANLASFHHKDFSGLLVYHSRDLAEMNLVISLLLQFVWVDSKIEVNCLDYLGDLCLK